tara:strand:- start:622 stop:963 length:342 start_codon:yes stop_codon:yes gene_type:complete
MSKLLPTRLPIANTPEISSEIYNRLVRILEINLGEFDPDNTRQITTAVRDTLYFDPGTLIWNTSIGVLQVYAGNYWIDIGTPTNPLGYEAQALVGNVSVKTNGNITIELTRYA